MTQTHQTIFYSMGAKTINRGRACDIEYGEYRPTSPLGVYVACIWTLRSARTLVEGIPHRVIPDTCMDLIFHRQSPSSLYEALLVGTMTRPLRVPLYGQEDYIGIRFRPGGMRHFLDVPVQELTDRMVPAEAIIGRMADHLPEQLAEARSQDRVLALLEGFLSDHIKADFQADLVEGAIRYIVHRPHNVSISRLARATGYSERHLRRRFKEAVGISPKTLSKIVRFRAVCRALTKTKTNSLGAALDCGYYDQAHFIREFKTFYDDTPSAFLRHRTA